MVVLEPLAQMVLLKTFHQALTIMVATSIRTHVMATTGDSLVKVIKILQPIVMEQMPAASLRFLMTLEFLD